MLERPEILLSSFFTVPFPRDLDFVERGTLLDQIYEKLSILVFWVALVGLSGVGYNLKGNEA
jgi:hypothetical protein